MAQRFHIRTRYQILFSMVWIAGILCGSFIAYQASDTYLLLMRGAANSPVSFTGLLAAVLLPFFFVTFSINISRPKLIYLICFLKTCIFMITAHTVMLSYGSAGWLIRALLQFTDTASLGLLCWFAYRHLDGSRERLWSDLGLCLICTACLGCIDYCYVSPFLVLLT